MAGVKRAATITRTGKNAVTVWAKRQCSHQSLQLPVDSLTVTVLPPATCLVHTGGDKETRRQSCLLKKNKIVPGIICQFRLALNMRPLTVSLTQAGLCWSELHCHHQQCRRQVFFFPGNKVTAHNYLQISLLYCLWLLLVIYTSDQWKLWRDLLA